MCQRCFCIISKELKYQVEETISTTSEEIKLQKLFPIHLVVSCLDSNLVSSLTAIHASSGCDIINKVGSKHAGLRKPMD